MEVEEDAEEEEGEDVMDDTSDEGSEVAFGKLSCLEDLARADTLRCGSRGSHCRFFDQASACRASPALRESGYRGWGHETTTRQGFAGLGEQYN